MSSLPRLSSTTKTASPAPGNLRSVRAISTKQSTSTGKKRTVASDEDISDHGRSDISEVNGPDEGSGDDFIEDSRSS